MLNFDSMNFCFVQNCRWANWFIIKNCLACLKRCPPSKWWTRKWTLACAVTKMPHHWHMKWLLRWDTREKFAPTPFCTNDFVFSDKSNQISLTRTERNDWHHGRNLCMLGVMAGWTFAGTNIVHVPLSTSTAWHWGQMLAGVLLCYS